MTPYFFDCPHCQKNHIPIESISARKEFNCPFCGKMVLVDDDDDEEPAVQDPQNTPKKPFSFGAWLSTFKKTDAPAGKFIGEDVQNLRGKITVDPLYNSQLAKTTEDVEDLRYIFSQGKGDNVMMDAFLNPLFPTDLIVAILKNRHSPPTLLSRAIRHRNCPPEMVVEMLEKNKGKDNELTRAAVFSDYCPTPILAHYLELFLKNGVENQTIINVAINQNAPAYIARRILERNKKDSVSLMLSKNAAMPKDAVGDWEIATGRLKDIWKIKKHQEAKAKADYEFLKKVQTENAQKAGQLQVEQDEEMMRKMREQDEARNNRPEQGG